MRYFDFLSPGKTEELFFIPPGDFDKYSEKELLENALGALLYFPAIKDGLVDFVQSNVHLKSIVFCLEDAIGDNQVAYAQKKLLGQLKELKTIYTNRDLTYLPLMFIRVRSPEHLREVGKEFREVLDLLTGFVFPKFDSKVAESYFSTFIKLKEVCTSPLYVCPILEGPEIIEREKRVASLKYIRDVLDKYRDHVLNLRLGATDFLGLFQLRRDVNHTIYDISLMKDCIGDIVNFFCRREDPYVVSGGVWEFFPQKEERDALSMEKLYRHPAMNKLIEEVQLDLVNGLWGKTVIHPSQLFLIQLNYIVPFEQYKDASDIISEQGSVTGVSSSFFANKMNEFKPHQYWAAKVLNRARVFGVLKSEVTYESFFNE